MREYLYRGKYDKRFSNCSREYEGKKKRDLNSLGEFDFDFATKDALAKIHRISLQNTNCHISMETVILRKFIYQLDKHTTDIEKTTRRLATVSRKYRSIIEQRTAR